MPRKSLAKLLLLMLVLGILSMAMQSAAAPENAAYLASQNDDAHEIVNEEIPLGSGENVEVVSTLHMLLIIVIVGLILYVSFRLLIRRKEVRKK